MTASEPSRSPDQTHPLWNCPVCGGTMHVVERLTARSYCFALHQNQIDVLHEPISASSASTRASARTQIPILICPRVHDQLSFQRPPNASMQPPPAPSGLQNFNSRRFKPVPSLTAHPQPHSKYIGFPVGGFLQVAVSEAPLRDHQNSRCLSGRSRYSTKTSQ